METEETPRRHRARAHNSRSRSPVLLYLLSRFYIMDSKHKIIQWNYGGLKPRYEELILFLTLLRPSVVCLQRIYLKDDDCFPFKSFNTYNYIHSDCLRAFVFVHSSCPQREIKLNTDRQAVTVSVTLEKELTLYSVYIPTSFALRSEHLNSLLATTYITVHFVRRL